MELENEKQAEKDPVVYFDPQRLPIEVWNQIFKDNSTKDLLNLSLVCKTLYETVGDLPEAMDRIALNLNQRTLQDVELIIKSSRNYNNINIEGIDFSEIEACKKIIAKFGSILRTLEFKFCYFAEDEFIEILEMTQKNLRSLAFSDSSVENDSAITPKAFKLSKLQRLEISSDYYVDDPILALLDYMPDTLLEVISDIELDSQFLKRQKKLKYLTFRLLGNTVFLDTMVDSTQIDFKLEKLDIGCLSDDGDHDSYKNLDKFLKPHAESLKELKFQNVSFDFLNMPNLQLLEIDLDYPRTDQYESGPTFNCPSLKTLIISSYGASGFLNFFSRFKNVQEIILQDMVSENLLETNTRMIEIIAENHPNLKTLVLDVFDDNAFKFLSFKNLKKLEISKINGYDDNNVMQALEINLENSIFAMENLEILKLSSDILATAPYLLFILVNFKKLKQLEINNGSKLSDGLLCRHLDFFKNLQFMKIFGLPGPVENFITGLSQFPNLKYSFSENDDD